MNLSLQPQQAAAPAADDTTRKFPSWYLNSSRDYRERINLMEECMRDLAAAKHGTRMQVYERWTSRCAHLGGFDQPTLGRRFAAWKAAGGSIEALRDKRREGRARQESDFLPAFKKACEENSRSSREAWRQMMRDLVAGKRLLGLGDWTDIWRAEQGAEAALPERCPFDELRPPRGATYANLMSRAGLTKYERTVARIGTNAAADFTLPVLTTRVGMLPGQWIQFDDVWLDFECKLTPTGAPMRIIEFSAYDVLSAHKIGCQRRPRVRNEDTGKATNASEKEFRCLVAHVLTGCGVHRDGVTFIIEHGTSTIRDELQRRIAQTALRHGLAVSFQMSGIMGDPVHEGMWRGKGGGNFRLKALTESSHNLLHNIQAALPAQTGHGEVMVEQLAAMKQYDASLVRAMARLPEEKVNLLRSPFPYFHNLAGVLALLDDRMADRTWHRLEGWRELGFIREMFQTADGHWHAMDALWNLPEVERNAVLAMLHQHPERVRPVPLSPRAVWAMGMKDLVRLDKMAIPDLLERQDGFAVRVQHNGTFKFTNDFFGPDEVIFHANVTDPSGFRRDLVPGREYWIYATPYLQDAVFVCDMASDAVLGMAPRYGRAARHDIDAVQALMGAKNAHQAAMDREIAARHQDAAAERTGLLAHNEPLLVEGGVLKPKTEATEPKPDAKDMRGLL